MATQYTFSDLSACHGCKDKVCEMDLFFDTSEFSSTGNNMLELVLKFLNFGFCETVGCGATFKLLICAVYL